MKSPDCCKCNWCRDTSYWRCWCTKWKTYMKSVIEYAYYKEKSLHD